MPSVPSFLAVWLFQLAVLQGAARSEAVCGQKGSSDRIVGGQPASDGEWPWQVSILEGRKHICGGSLIGEQWVVTAAHCVTKGASNYDVVLGAYQLSNYFLEQSEIFTVTRLILQDFDGIQGSSGDIALVQLSSPVNFTSRILPICLPDSSAEFSGGTMCWVTGWGQIQSGENLGYPQTLQELEVPIIDRATCNHLFSINPEDDLESNPVKEDMICAGYEEGGKDSCQGDSGGPLACQRDRGWVLAGVVSWGVGCAQPNHPGVYASVPYYADWISQQINSGLQRSFTLPLLLGCVIFAVL